MLERMTSENRRFYTENTELLGALAMYLAFKRDGGPKGNRPLKEFDDWLEDRIIDEKQITVNVSEIEKAI